MRGGVNAAGPMAVAAGAVAAYQALDFFIDENNESTKSLKRLSSAYEKTAETTEKNIGRLNKLGDATEQYATVFNDSNATVRDVMKAHEAASAAMAELPKEIRDSISGFLDPREMQHAIKIAREGEQDKKDAAKNAVDNQRDVNDIRGENFGFTAGKGELDKQEDVLKGQDIAKRIFAQMAPEDRAKLFEAGNSNMDRMMSSFKHVGKNSNSASRAGVMDSMGAAEGFKDLDKKTLIQLEKAMANGTYEAHHIAEGFISVGRGMQESSIKESMLNKIREDTINHTKKQLDAIRDAERAMVLENKIRKATLPILKKGAEAFLTGTGKVALKEKMGIDAIKAETAVKFKSAVGGANTAFGMAGSLSGTTTGTAIEGIIAEAIKKGPAGVDSGKVEAQIVAVEGMIKGAKEGIEKENLKDVVSQLQNLNGTSIRLEKDQQESILFTKQIAKAERQVAKQAQRLKSFGGAQSIINPGALDGTINQIRGGEQAMGMTAGRNRTGFNRANATRLAGIQTLLGGELPEHLKNKGIAAATQVKTQDVSLMNKRFNLGMSKKEIHRVASEQAASLFKGQPLDQNNKELGTLNTTMAESNKLWSRIIEGDIVGMEQLQGATRQRQADFNSFRTEAVPGAERVAKAYTTTAAARYENKGTSSDEAKENALNQNIELQSAIKAVQAGGKSEIWTGQKIDVHIDNTKVDTDAILKQTVNKLADHLQKGFPELATQFRSANKP
jgi:hypothetical protein